jgi:D-xylose transport system substrate-binding protein
MRTPAPLAVGIVAVLGLTAAACGDDDSKASSSSTTKAAASSTTAAAGASTTAAAGSSTTAAAGSSTTAAASGGGGKIGVILPDSKSSARWETADRKYLTDAIKAAGFEPVIQNAEGDKQKMATIADSMISQKVKVLMIVNLDSESGTTILKKAKDAGIKTIDYDRLTLADVYVSFNNVTVGELQGDGLIKCINDKGVKNPKIAELNGSPTDNNATLFKQGYDSKIKPKFASGEWTLVDDQSVPDWDNQKGGQIFEQMLAKAGGKVDGVLAANDGLGGAAIAVLKKNNLQVPVTGQDATADGLRAILTGDQCMTVYKAIKTEADAASKAAIALASGQKPATNGTVKDTKLNTDVPSVLAVPVPIYKANVKDVIADGYVTKADVCKDLASQCAAAGIS